MKISNSLYTYPVLSNSGLRDDYIESSSFSAQVEKVQSGVNEISLCLSVTLEDQNLRQLLEKGMITVVCHIESSLSSFRDILNVNPFDMSTTIVVDPARMRGILEISTLIVAVNEIDNFSSNTFGDFYAGSYNIERRNILAFAPTIEVEIEPGDTDKTPTKSIIRVNPNDKREMTVDLTDEYIVVYVPQSTYAGYTKLSSKNRPHFEISLMSIILPALMEAISEIKYGDGGSDNKIWARVIREKLKAGGRGSDADYYDPLLHAQFLLNNPVDNMFAQIIESHFGEDE